MRINVYAEEFSDRIEIVEKTTNDGTFTGLRFYLELPATVMVCGHCGTLKQTHEQLMPKCPIQYGDEHLWQPRNLSGPFMHHPGDDDSSAVTFWGKRNLRELLKLALAKLDGYYGVTKILTLDLPEEDRQMVLLALAVLSLESPGFDHALNEIALRIDNRVRKINSIEGDRDRAEMYDKFRELRRDSVRVREAPK